MIPGTKYLKTGQLIFEQPGNAETLLNEIYAHFEIAYPKFHKMDMLCKLGFLATEILLSGTDHQKKYGETETGLVLSNTHASLDVDLKYAKTIQTGASPALFVYTLPNIVIGEIAIRHHFKGENAFFVFKQFDGNFIDCICKRFIREQTHQKLYLRMGGHSERRLPCAFIPG